MATLPSNASLTGATTTNAQQKTNFTSILTFLSDLLGTDSANKTAARLALGVPGTSDFSASRNANGYIKIPTATGTITLQWCSSSATAVSANAQTNISTSWPTPFSTLLFSAPVSFIPSASLNGCTMSSNGGTASTVSAAVYSTTAQNVTVSYIGIGI